MISLLKKKHRRAVLALLFAACRGIGAYCTVDFRARGPRHPEVQKTMLLVRRQVSVGPESRPVPPSAKAVAASASNLRPRAAPQTFHDPTTLPGTTEVSPKKTGYCGWGPPGGGPAP